MGLQRAALHKPANQSVAAYVRDLADIYSVVYSETPADDFAETASRLVGDDLPPPDETENLLVALYRAGVIDAHERTNLLFRHVQQTA
ncbi:hypothetical protein [Microvirga alba]|uniref:Uncharacterized protein n=1 Tax=Microvirga alba TaxID=2791025 RepID=A0A931BVS5_9HYPH|nr:hypothetical protein [Microvirga alba]MBF9235623.1 hypothetical protein [Microvirga alba]